MSMVKRLPPGTSGIKTKVLTNSYEIKQLPNGVFHHYDVITRKNPEAGRSGSIPKRLYALIVDQLQIYDYPQVFEPKGAYDGVKSMFMLNPLRLPDGASGTTFEVPWKGERGPDAPRGGGPARGGGRGGGPDRGPRTVFLVKMTKVAEIGLAQLQLVIQGRVQGADYQTAIQLLNVILRQAPSMNNVANNGKSFFAGERQPLVVDGRQGVLEMCKGWFQSVRPSIGRMLINVDVAMAILYQSAGLIEVTMAYLGFRNARDLANLGHSNAARDIQSWTKLRQFLKGVFVQAGLKETRRKKKILTLVSRAGYFEFEGKQGTRITVKDYYLTNKNYRLNHPDAPGIQVAGDSVFPFELCHIEPGQFYKTKATPDMMQQILKFTTIRPNDRLQQIQKGLQLLNWENSHFVRQSGMRISNTPVEVNARILPSPTLIYGGDQAVRVNNGAWNLLNQRFLVPARIESWGLAIFDRNLETERGRPVIQQFLFELIKCLRSLGLTVPNAVGNHGLPIRFIYPQANLQDEMSALVREIQAMFPTRDEKGRPKQPSILLVVLAPGSADIRAAVKQFGDTFSGIPTQCIKRDKLPADERDERTKKRLNQYCNNLALKMNAKMGGLNTLAKSPSMQEFCSKPAMVIGADVAHAAPGAHRPSVVGFVSSFDEKCAQYVAQCEVQAPRTENIANLSNMVHRALELFVMFWKKWVPEKILFFRDGVSEGELENVIRTEIAAIQDGIDRFWKVKVPPFPTPKVTFIVVGKRHHVRFFPKTPQDADRSGNCPAGLIVDGEITSPIMFDYFLQSHSGLLGTSRPSHYIVLKNDIGLTSDQLQELSYTLCYNYARATRAVSIPAPVYYADIVCSRGAFHFDPNLNFDDGATVSSGEGGQFNLDRWERGFRPVTEEQARRMYYM